MSFASVSVIVACLLILGCFSLLAVNLNEIMSALESDNQVIAYCDENMTEEAARALVAEIEDIQNVESADFISNEQAWIDFREQYENSEMLENLEADVLRHRYIVFMTELSEMEQTMYELKDVDGIVKVSGHLKIADGFVTIRHIATLVFAALAGILLIVSMFIMSNTVKLTTFERREEIAIMKMVGATSGFIRWPFVVEGMILGIVGSLVAFIAQWGIYKVISDRIVADSGLSFLKMIPFGDFAIPMLVVFGGVGLFVGIVGSLTAIKNYLKV